MRCFGTHREEQKRGIVLFKHCNGNLILQLRKPILRIVEIRTTDVPIQSRIRNSYIDFSKMTLSLVALVTDVVRDGRRVIGYGFNSNGRYGQSCLIRERFAPRLREAEPKSLLNDSGANFDPDRVWAAMMQNEKPGGHGERSVAVGAIDMAVWDAVAKIEGQAAVPSARRAPQSRSESARVRLRRRRLLRARTKDLKRCARKCAATSIWAIAW